MPKSEPPIFNLAGKSSDSTSKIETIKNLIFGDQMQAYEAEFEVLKKDMASKKDELDKLIDDVRAELMKSIDELSTEVGDRISELEKNLYTKVGKLEENTLNKKDLGNVLIKLGEKISKE